MIDETQSTESTKEVLEELEELKVEDGDIDINDIEASFNSAPQAEATNAGAGDNSAVGKAEPEGAAAAEPPVDRAAIAALEAQIATLKAQVEERSSQYMRIAADFENYRRRTAREREDQELQLKGTIITDLLPVVDNFERARAHIKPQTDGEMTIHKSYQGVYKQLVEVLKSLGVAAMRAEGQEFDPNFHEAVMREATAEHPEGTVIEELVRGYVLGERVLRHAMVKVAVAPEPGADEAGSDAEGDA